MDKKKKREREFRKMVLTYILFPLCLHTKGTFHLINKI